MATDQPVERRVGETLREREETVAVAESCTGGLLGSRITGVDGASDYFVGGIIAYQNRAKLQLLAVTREMLAEHGPVSRPVARAMAQHIRDEADADWGLSTTGYAGPTSGDPDTPVGTVYVGVAYAGSADASVADDADAGAPWTVVERYQFDGDRTRVKEQAVEQTLSTALEQMRAAAGDGQSSDPPR
jgi:nicotinamide-nucleotide amidase